MSRRTGVFFELSDELKEQPMLLLRPERLQSTDSVEGWEEGN